MKTTATVKSLRKQENVPVSRNSLFLQNKKQAKTYYLMLIISKDKIENEKQKNKTENFFLN